MTTLQSTEDTIPVPGLGCYSQNNYAQSWFKDETRMILHRLDGPARIYANGAEEWWMEGKRHREDGPAIISSDGHYEAWFLHGLAHRVDGPSFSKNNGDEDWKRHGKLHREDGPAIIKEGILQWWQNGLKHREDGPAIINNKIGNSEQWWLNGKRHRTDGPAAIKRNGTLEWWQHGALHRLDGPAKEFANGNKKWYLFGNACSSEQVLHILEIINENLGHGQVQDIPYAVLEEFYKSLGILNQ